MKKLLIYGLFVELLASSSVSCCSISIVRCNHRPDLEGRTFADDQPSPHESACYVRATAYNNWCQNHESVTPSVISTFIPTGHSQVLTASSCDIDWILFDHHCFLYIEAPATWREANEYCNRAESALASIHSDRENSFVHFLTGGRSSWIGFVDVKASTEQVEDFRWTDNSQVDYRNWNGTESDPSLQRHEQEWYQWDSTNPAPFVCKKRSRSESDRITTDPIDAIIRESTSATSKLSSASPVEEPSESTTPVTEWPKLLLWIIKNYISL